MPLSPLMNWVSLIFFGGLLVILGFAADTRIALFRHTSMVLDFRYRLSSFKSFQPKDKKFAIINN